MINQESEDHHNMLFSNLLIWMASADENLLENNPQDKRKIHLIGLSVMMTWIFATVAWMYFFSTVTDAFVVIIPAGLLLGFVILTIDRVLIAGISGSNQMNYPSILFRLLLASCLGAFLAQPALMFLFKKDINVQLGIDQEVRKQEKITQLNRSYQPLLHPLYLEKDSLAKDLFMLDSMADVLRIEFIKEADGSGGTGKVGIAMIAKAKKEALDQQISKKQLWTANTQPYLNQLQMRIDSLESAKIASFKSFTSIEDDGFLNRINALQHLLAQNPTLQWRYYLLLVILMLIELAPLLSKLLLKTPVYRQRLLQQQNNLMQLDQYRFQKNLVEDKMLVDHIHNNNIHQMDRLNNLDEQFNQSFEESLKNDVITTPDILKTYQTWMKYLRNRLIGNHTP